MTALTIAELSRLPTSAMSEVELLRAMGVRRIEPRSETCACGAVIRVDDAGDEWLIGRAVHVHNLSTGHEQWAIREGWR